MWESAGLLVLLLPQLFDTPRDSDLVLALLEKCHHEGLLGAWSMATQEAHQSRVNTLAYKIQKPNPFHYVNAAISQVNKSG